MYKGTLISILFRHIYSIFFYFDPAVSVFIVIQGSRLMPPSLKFDRKDSVRGQKKTEKFYGFLNQIFFQANFIRLFLR